MEWSKVKNIIILLLLLVNGCLLVLVGMGWEESGQYQRSALTQTIQVLEEHGIQVEQSGLADAAGLVPQTVGRSLQGEGRMAQILLEEAVEAADQGGGLYIYENDRGWVSFRAGGAVSAALSQPPGRQEEDPQAHAAALLEDMDIQARQTDAQLSQDGTGYVRFQQQWQGSPLLSSQVTFTYDQGRLTGLEGTLLAWDQEQVTTGESTTLITLPTAMMRFLDEILSSGEACSAIQSMQPGYLVSQSYSGSVSLTPAWLIQGNTASYYLDAATGTVSLAG